MEKQKINLKWIILHNSGAGSQIVVTGPFNSYKEAEDYAHTKITEIDLDFVSIWESWSIRNLESPDKKTIETNKKLDKEIEIALAKNRAFLGLKEKKNEKKKNRKRLAKKKI